MTTTMNRLLYKHFGVRSKRELSKEGKLRMKAILEGEDAYTATSTGKWYRYKYFVMEGVAKTDDTIIFGRKK